MKNKKYNVWEYDLRNNDWENNGVIIGTNLTYKQAIKLVGVAPDYALRIIEIEE